MGGAISFNQIEKALRGSRERRTLADGHDPLALTPDPDPNPNQTLALTLTLTTDPNPNPSPNPNLNPNLGPSKPYPNPNPNQALMDHDHYCSAIEAKELGLVDHLTLTLPHPSP